MALNTFPTTRTLGWSVLKAPNWATRMQRAVSGRELRVADYILPLYTFTLVWEVLKDRWDQRMGEGKGPAYSPPGVTPFDELRQIWNFFNGQQGGNIPFLFNDPSDSGTRTVSATPSNFNFAVGDGTTTTFQMASPLLAPVVPNVISSVNLNGAPTSAYTVDLNTGLITFTAAPGNGVLIGADYTYSYIVRFASDSLEAENFAYQFWQMKQLKLISVLF